MSQIIRLSLQNVRCFAEPQAAELGKITLLVGENNTGKSTFLGCYKEFARLAGLYELSDPAPDQPGFDDPPYSMGDFSTIARHQSDTFVLDGVLEGHCHTHLRLAFGQEQGQPSENAVALHFQAAHGAEKCLTVSRNPGRPASWEFRAAGNSLVIPQADLSYRQISTWLSQRARHGLLPYLGSVSTYRKRIGTDATFERQTAFANMTNFLREMPFPTEPIAVISVDPSPPPRQRYYAQDLLGVRDLEVLREYLASTGDRLKLFSEIDIKRGSQARDGLFELRIRQGGAWHNLADVGYGVHSILQVLRVMSDKRVGVALLLQQPEVHIHPSAQAVLAQMMAESTHRFVIETHSDHLIDRFRICVMKGVLAPADFRIVYFERNPESGESLIHNISVDRAGNLEGEPDGYRKFFLQETNRLLGFD